MTIATLEGRPDAPAHQRNSEVPPSGRSDLARSRRRLQVALGLLWLLDAALQFQPYMFSKAFATETMGSTAAGNPLVVAHPITWVAEAVGGHAVLCNTLFAVVQLALAVGLFWRRTLKLALGASIVWALGVWWFGEGLGGVLTGATSPFMGAPGAAVLYVFAALLVWPRRPVHEERSPACSGSLGVLVPRLCWLALWGSLSWQFLAPSMRTTNALGAMLSGMADGEPHWLGALDRTLGSAFAGDGLPIAIALAVVCAAVGLSVFVPRLVGAGVVLAILVGAFIWVMEDFGGIFTGMGTDPNSGPLLILLATAFWLPRSMAPWRTRRRPGIAFSRVRLLGG